MLKRILLWKYLIVVVIIMGFCIYVTRKDQKTRDEYEQKCSQLNASVTSPSGHYEDCDKGAEDAARHLPRWYRVFYWPDGITTWAILLTLLVIADQTTQTRRSAEASEVAAKAALLNAQALINSERPWIVMTIEPGKELNQFILKAVNRGRTPAAISLDEEGLCAVEPGTALPAVPQYTQITKYDAPFMLIQDESHTVLRWDRKRLRMMCNNRERLAKIEDCSLMTYVFGRVVYRDLLTPPDAAPHETRWFCMVWLTEDPDQFFLGEGPGEYTKHT